MYPPLVIRRQPLTVKPSGAFPSCHSRPYRPSVGFFLCGILSPALAQSGQFEAQRAKSTTGCPKRVVDTKFFEFSVLYRNIVIPTSRSTKRGASIDGFVHILVVSPALQYWITDMNHSSAACSSFNTSSASRQTTVASYPCFRAHSASLCHAARRTRRTCPVWQARTLSMNRSCAWTSVKFSMITTLPISLCVWFRLYTLANPTKEIERAS